MKRLIFTLMTVLLSLTMFISCSNENDDPITEQETGEILIDTYVDDELLTTTKATVYLNGGYATGAGKYKGNTEAFVEAIPNQGYKLESFEGNEGKCVGSSSYTVTVPPATKIYFTAKFKKEETQNASLTINFIDKNVQNKYEHMWVDVTINGTTSTAELDLRTGGWSSVFVRNATMGATFTLSNFRSHYVASGTADEARQIFNTTNNYGVVYCNEKSGSFGKSSTISGTLNGNTTYTFYID
ncbi:InlB B-repeat-containing protein [Massilibacteroides vaginae]|uniref:InlB B-repeat-containing protein n=1 Tax=Massilibacteroides vaginae TaxID=1673718 RepID=UPI000A1CB799|nr:hypothetical protein [Massilibacteroides vaginae]